MLLSRVSYPKTQLLCSLPTVLRRRIGRAAKKEAEPGANVMQVDQSADMKP